VFHNFKYSLAVAYLTTWRCYARTYNRRGLLYFPRLHQGDCLIAALSDCRLSLDSRLRLGLTRFKVKVIVRVKDKVTLRPAVCCQSVRLGVKTLETHYRKYFEPKPCGPTPVWRDGFISLFSRCSHCTDPTALFLCWCGWRIARSIVTALSAWSRTAWQYRFPQLSYCSVTSPQTRARRVPLLHASAIMVTWSGSRGKVFYSAIPSQRPSLLIKHFRHSADMPHYIRHALHTYVVYNVYILYACILSSNK
jgi:hypothetical protein